MSIEVISFDAAHTLVDVHWQPGAFAVSEALRFGLDIDPQVGEEKYMRLLQTRWRGYQELNLQRDEALGDAFWDELTQDWLDAMRVEGDGRALSQSARERMFGPDSPCFRIYEDVVPTLESLASAGFRLIVLSNWDYTLRRTLTSLGLTEHFEFIFASLEEGPEKPEVALFRIVEQAMGVEGESIVHVGDNFIDDLQGARDAGWGAVLLDRATSSPRPPAIASLSQIPEALRWNA